MIADKSFDWSPRATSRAGCKRRGPSVFNSRAKLARAWSPERPRRGTVSRRVAPRAWWLAWAISADLSRAFEDDVAFPAGIALATGLAFSAAFLAAGCGSGSGTDAPATINPELEQGTKDMLNNKSKSYNDRHKAKGGRP